MRFEFHSAVLWVVYFIICTDCGANLFWNFRGNYFNFSENRFPYFGDTWVCFHLLASPIILLPLSASPVYM